MFFEAVLAIVFIIFGDFVISPQIEKIYQKLGWKYKWRDEILALVISFWIILLPLLILSWFIIKKRCSSKNKNKIKKLKRKFDHDREAGGKNKIINE